MSREGEEDDGGEGRGREHTGQHWPLAGGEAPRPSEARGESRGSGRDRQLEWCQRGHRGLRLREQASRGAEGRPGHLEGVRWDREGGVGTVGPGRAGGFLGGIKESRNQQVPERWGGAGGGVGRRAP